VRVVTRAAAVEALRARTATGRALLGVGAGTGLVARAAEAGGADLIVLYNSGRFRAHGLPSLAGLMPYGDANAIVVEMGREIVPAVRSAPVLAGVCATDPFRDMEAFLPELHRMGFAGVQNFPTVGLIDGRFREDLEATGIGFAREVEMIRLASSLGLLTCAFVCDEDAAAAMARAGADVVAPHLGVTRPGLDLDDAVERVQRMRDAAVAVRPDVLVLFHGGPAGGPAEVQHVLDRTDGVAGFFAASSVERAPVEAAVEGAARSFAGLRAGPPAQGVAAPEPEEELDLETLPAYLRRHGLVPDGAEVRCEYLGGGISNVLMRYRVDGDCGVVKQSRSRIRVAEEWLCDVRRILTERDAIRYLHGLLPPGVVPRIRFSEDANYLFVMDCAPEGARLWKTDLMEGSVDPGLARAAGVTLGTIHGRTAGDAALRARFGTDLLSQLRLEPYYAATARRHPDLAEHIDRGARRLLTDRSTLVHGDYVPKNMLVVGEGRLLLLDFEIAHYGNPAYDVATFTNHLLLKAFRFPERAPALLGALEAFRDAYAAEAGGARPDDEAVLLQLGCLMLARVDGKSPVEYLEDEPTKDRVRAAARSILQGHAATVDEAVALAATAMTRTAQEVTS